MRLGLGIERGKKRGLGVSEATAAAAGRPRRLPPDGTTRAGAARMRAVQSTPRYNRSMSTPGAIGGVNPAVAVGTKAPNQGPARSSTTDRPFAIIVIGFG